MELEILQQILTELKDLKSEVKDIKQGQANLETEVKEIRKQQQKDSSLLQSVFDQTAHLTEHEIVVNEKFKKLKAAL